MLIIDNELVHRFLNMSDCIEVQKQAFARLLTGEAIFRPRVDVYVPCDVPDGYYRFGSYEGATGGYLATRLKSDILTWSKGPDGSTTETNYCIEPGTYCGLVLLFSSRTGEPLAIFNDGNLQHMRVGASAGIGASLLSRPESRTVGMIGSGSMARTYLSALCKVRPIERARIFSRSRDKREAYAAEMSRELGIPVEPVDSAEAAVKGADIVATATNATQPTFDAAWLEPGMHVTIVRSPEISPELAARADVKVVQGREDMPMEEHGFFRKGIAASPNSYVSGTPEEQARLPAPRMRRFSDKDWPVYTDILSGAAPGRTSPEQVTLYNTMGNWGVQFASVCGHVYETVKAAGEGRHFPTEWLLQDVRN